MDMHDSAVKVTNLVKRYKELVAVDHLNLDIKEGEVFGLLGPNGSGKTTTINCILSLLAYDKGEIEIFGEKWLRIIIKSNPRLASSCKMLLFLRN